MKLPAFVQIEPVGQCNLACRMCPVTYRGEGGKPPAFMSFDAFCRVLDEFPAIEHLQLQGMGEPFLHPRFLDMVRHAVARGIEVTTNTNLTALSPRRADELVGSGLAKLHVSIDAADPAAYEYIRVGSNLSRVLRNLALVQDAKKRLRSDRPEIILVAVAMRRNLAELPRLVRLAAEYGIHAMSVQHLAHDFSEGSLPERYRSMRDFVDGETLLHEETRPVFDQARALAKELGVDLRLPNLQPKPGPRSCDWPWRGAYVAYSGQAMPCCMIATPDRLNFGNMARDGVVRVWNSEEYNAFRARLASDDPPDICKGCAVYNGHF